MIRFSNRRDAGQQLAAKLTAYKDKPDVIVLGIPRGGVVVAAQVARALNVPLDIFITRKIGAPFNHELALGAVASDGTVVLDEPLIHELRVPRRLIERETEIQKREIRRRLELFRKDRPALALENKTVIVVDDGIATGSTIIAALRALRHSRPARLVLAVPVKPFRAKNSASSLLFQAKCTPSARTVGSASAVAARRAAISFDRLCNGLSPRTSSGITSRQRT